MSFQAPYLSKDELRQRADQFLQKHNPNCTIPVPIEFIIESDFAMDIVPVPGLHAGFDVVAFITKDMTEIRVDEYVYMNRLNRYRFSLAHELAHRIRITICGKKLTSTRSSRGKPSSKNPSPNASTVSSNSTPTSSRVWS